jgi:protein-S-isoprenylcysteine O-methyltransferase Ste14
VHFNASTIATVLVVLLGGALAAPVLIKGFVRRGTGVKYEQSFLIQRAPQYASLFNILLIALGYLAYNGILPGLSFLAATTDDSSSSTISTISWLGVPILLSGMVFMIGGWYSLGEFFSTDAEVLSDHKVKNTGLLRYVMHPAYSGIIQCLLGASIGATSLVAVLFCLLVVAPLWLRRAKYEERLLIENLGQPYKEYAEQTKWRRLVPTFIPIGV